MTVKITQIDATHDGAGDAAILTDSGESWTVDEFIGLIVDNITDGSAAPITDNDGTTVTGTLAGGTENDWDVDDVGRIRYYANLRLTSKIFVPSCACIMTVQAAMELNLVTVKDKGGQYNVCFATKADRDAGVRPALL